MQKLEVSGGDVLPVVKRKKHIERSDSIRTSQFVHRVQDIIDTNAGTPMRAIARNIHVSECTILKVVYEDIR